MERLPRAGGIGPRLRRIFQALDRDVPALPIDGFRACLGGVFFAYFVSLLVEVPSFSSPDGLLDHRLVQEMFWYTRISLFQPGMAAWQFEVIFLLAALGSLAVLVGYRPRLFAGGLFLVAVSAYRWNFPVMYFDDAIMHLMMAWVVLLPVGRTLVLGNWIREGRSVWSRWRAIRVPGMAVRCLAWNLTLVFFVAGWWKLGSPMWREGVAVPVALQTPAAWAPEFWSRAPLGALWPLTYLALGFELSYPLLVLLPKRHPVKMVLLAGLAGFHIATIATLRVPYANFALFASALVLCREEIADWLGSPALPSISLPPVPRRRLRPDAALALAVVVVLTIAVAPLGATAVLDTNDYGAAELGIDPRDTGRATTIRKAAYAVLWFGGIAQRYELFDWIDVRNYALRSEVRMRDQSGVWWSVDPTSVFPRSGRAALMEGYLHDHVWLHVPAGELEAFRSTLVERFPQRFCRSHPSVPMVVARSTMVRIPARPRGGNPVASDVLLRFRCEERTAEILEAHSPGVHATWSR